MKIESLFLTIVLMWGPAVPADDAAPRLCEPWQSEYSGKDATGEYVIALWQFSKGKENEDASGHGHGLKLEGAEISPDGRFGSCLESFPGWPVGDKRHRAVVANSPDLSPKGAFTIEMWIKPKPEMMKDYPSSFLLDKKYVAHDDYQLILNRVGRTESYSLQACLGFGADSERYYSDKLKLEPGVWYHLAFTYDGAGTGRFYLNGMSWGETQHPGRKSISPGRHVLSIGDRIGSYYHGFPGYIDQVRISKGVLEFRRARFAFASERTSYVRMEKGRLLRFDLVNLERSPVKGGRAWISVDGLNPKEIALPELQPGKTHVIEYPLDTGLRPGRYHVKARISIPGGAQYESEESFPIVIAPRRPPRMPVVMWGAGLKEIPRLKELGFTHAIGLSANFGRIWEASNPADEKEAGKSAKEKKAGKSAKEKKAGKPVEAADPERARETKRLLDEALAEGICAVATLSPGRWARHKKEFQRINRQGKPYGREDVCGLFPEIKKFCFDVGAAVARTYGDFPAFDAALIHTEVRGDSQICFHDHDKAAFRRFAGFDIPEEVQIKNGVKYEDLRNFPADRVIPDDHPIYVFYKWFWKEGDGWNGLHTAVHRGLKTTPPLSGRKGFWTWHDPAVRVASVYGNGGEVDILSQWTYSYPDPIRIGLATDELFAMARGAAHKQQVMKMTQIIWYRSQTAPKKKPAGQNAPRSVWEDTDPDADFITIAPMHLREAFWTKISRPIRGIMYHGWQSLVKVDRPASYRYTHPETRHELRRLVKTVVEPLGPTLLQVPDVESDVAFLESFASQMFARRGTYGWNGGWAGNAYHIIQYAHLQPEVIYDETVVQRGLDDYRVLFLMDCDVLTKTVAGKIKQFQEKGGIVVGDERLCPAIQPDILLESYTRTRKADADKAELLKLAAKLRRELDPHYRRYVDSSNPEVVVRRRRYGGTDYVFAVNDRREYGDYVGQYGLVMENGLPAEADLTIGRAEGVVYDLVNARPVPAAKEGGRLRIHAGFGPCEGRLFMVTPRAIESVRIEGPARVERGASADIRITIADADGRPLDAVVPVRVDILDPDARPAEFSGYYGAAGGRLDVHLDIAPNDVRGIWRVRVREGASGLTADHYFRVHDAGG